MWMLERGASPELRNESGETAYQVSGSRLVRLALSRWRASHEAEWDWSSAGVPMPPSEASEAARAAKTAEKRRKEKERKKERKTMEAAAAAVEAEKLRYLNLSDREKRALAAEARLGQSRVLLVLS